MSPANSAGTHRRGRCRFMLLLGVSLFWASSVPARSRSPGAAQSSSPTTTGPIQAASLQSSRGPHGKTRRVSRPRRGLRGMSYREGRRALRRRLAFVLPFGTIYSPNITPDKDTGIGKWTDSQFLGAVHEGIDPGAVSIPRCRIQQTPGDRCRCAGDQGVPVQPQAGQTGNTPNALRFPSISAGLWRVVGLFRSRRALPAERGKSAEWNRGAYIAEALEHCGECHTPRNLASRSTTAENSAARCRPDGAPITSAATRERCRRLERHGTRRISLEGHANGRGTAAGPMGEAVDLSFRHLAPGETSTRSSPICARCRR